MTTEWYYANGGQRLGPVSETEFDALRRSGQIRPQTLVWREGMLEWKPLSEAIVALAPSPVDGGYCTVCGRNVGAENLIAFHSSRVCADCKEPFFRQLREQGVTSLTHGGAQRYAGFWIRLLAVFLDALIISAVTWPLSIAVFLFSGMRNMANNRAADPTLVLVVLGRVGLLYLFVFILQVIYQ